ncbi:hypothetical protein NIES2119_09130 [[Phormidium ambiguum] IAM M-71]|uniref:Uncharacterized protein n=1 Tax=[Phormidium ambiguum] IAM M-71 TaxID=454136 RepID=A0A1U7IN96_9CYAN|nr:hypothetical protein NIES2119_09130 [Phormidium ambiguum IAM M-71]
MLSQKLGWGGKGTGDGEMGRWGDKGTREKKRDQMIFPLFASSLLYKSISLFTMDRPCCPSLKYG